MLSLSLLIPFQALEGLQGHRQRIIEVSRPFLSNLSSSGLIEKKMKCLCLSCAALNGTGWVTTHTLMSRDFEWKRITEHAILPSGVRKKRWDKRHFVGHSKQSLWSGVAFVKVLLTSPLPYPSKPRPLPTLCFPWQVCLLLSGLAWTILHISW